MEAARAAAQGWRESLESVTRGCWDSVSLSLGPQLSQGW